MQVLRDADGEQALRVELDAVDVDGEGVIYGRLNPDTVLHKARLSRAIRPMNEYIASTR